jgi:3-hydroxyisobutyrate dehydrogenase-like beta-hydroxyacid dehydrogenase
MAANEMKRINANAELTAAIAAAIKAAHEAGLSADDVRAALDRFSELLNEE